MDLGKRIELVKGLRHVLSNLSADELEELGWKARSENTWFTQESVGKALEGIKNMLSEEQLALFADKYVTIDSGKTIGLVLAGNIPAVGFHDILCAFLSGAKVKAKLSHQDAVLIKFLINELKAIGGSEEIGIDLIEKLDLSEVDAVIATGSDNSARYFEQYFSAVPNIIRKNRTSVAVLTGEETEEELKLLVQDVTTYYGLGCRNVTKLLVPKGFDLIPVLRELESRSDLLDHTKYAHNYDYNKSILLVNGDDHFDSGNALFKESSELFSAVSVLNYEYYDGVEELEQLLAATKNQTQCVVGRDDRFVSFGDAQCPGLLDYADGVDTVAFIQGL